MSRNALFSGWATKCGGKTKNWKRRFFQISPNGEVVYGVDQNSLAAPLGTFDLNHAVRVCSPGICTFAGVIAPPQASQDVRVEVELPQRTYLLFFDNETQAKAFVQAVHKAVPNLHSATFAEDFSGFSEMLSKVARENDSKFEDATVDEAGA
eukprot:m.49555 g.49555  ORF g.49555 m.49555 type:complete len:152 (-) comp12833_c0_seq1:233-688(-)